MLGLGDLFCWGATSFVRVFLSQEEERAKSSQERAKSEASKAEEGMKEREAELDRTASDLHAVEAANAAEAEALKNPIEVAARGAKAGEKKATGGVKEVAKRAKEDADKFVRGSKIKGKVAKDESFEDKVGWTRWRITKFCYGPCVSRTARGT